MLLRKTIADTGPIITLDIADEFALDFLTELELRLCLSKWIPNKISDISNAVWLYFVIRPTGIESGTH